MRGGIPPLSSYYLTPTTNKKMLIGINGYSGSGKDTIGKLLQDLYPDQNWKIKKFAGKLKTVASLLTGIPESNFEDLEFKKTILGTEWWTPCDEGVQPMTVRELLQKLGTDGLRNGLHENVWVNALIADYKPEVVYRLNQTTGALESHTDNKLPNWVITDVRFPNEAKVIKESGGYVIRVDRPGIKPINNHRSETSLDGWNFDYKIGNVSDVLSLAFTVSNIMEEIFKK